MTTPENAIRNELKRQSRAEAKAARRRAEHVPQCLCRDDRLQIHCAQWGTECLLNQPPEQRRGRPPEFVKATEEITDDE